jgi:hypothetical protein
MKTIADRLTENDGITPEQWAHAIKRGTAYRCPQCGRRNVGTWLCNGLPCLNYDCRGRYAPVVESISAEVA